jgi:hypothetical protein
VSPKHRQAWLGFALCALLSILSLFVLHGVASGIVSLATMLVFIGACIYALRGEDAETRARSDRTGMAGWFGGWF